MCAFTSASKTRPVASKDSAGSAVTVRAGGARSARSMDSKQGSPEWRIPRAQQELVTWASSLDRIADAGECLPGARGDTKTVPPAYARTGWSFLMHLTFRNPIPNHHAMTAGAHLNSWCSGWRTPAKDCAFRLLLWSAESHILGNVHLHALSVCTPLDFAEHMRLRRSRGRESWSRECGPCSQRAVAEGPDWRRLKESWYVHHGIARVFPFDPRYRFGAERYVTKYILDEKCLDWGIETW